MRTTRLLSATYYLDVLSCWCHWAEPAWAALRERHGQDMSFEWKIALMDGAGVPGSRAECDAFQRRAGVIVRSPYRLSSGWVEEGLRDYSAPNLVAEAARDLGVDDDRVRLALARAGLIEGKRVGRMEEAARIGAEAAGLDTELLAAHAGTAGVATRLRETTGEFRGVGGTRRPTFLMENDMGDRVIVSGWHGSGLLLAAADALAEGSAALASWRAHFGDDVA